LAIQKHPGDGCSYEEVHANTPQNGLQSQETTKWGEHQNLPTVKIQCCVASHVFERSNPLQGDEAYTGAKCACSDI
jgi:hypothetical protein